MKTGMAYSLLTICGCSLSISCDQARCTGHGTLSLDLCARMYYMYLGYACARA